MVMVFGDQMAVSWIIRGDFKWIFFTCWMMVQLPIRHGNFDSRLGFTWNPMMLNHPSDIPGVSIGTPHDVVWTSGIPSQSGCHHHPQWPQLGGHRQFFPRFHRVMVNQPGVNHWKIPKSSILHGDFGIFQWFNPCLGYLFSEFTLEFIFLWFYHWIPNKLMLQTWCLPPPSLCPFWHLRNWRSSDT